MKKNQKIKRITLVASALCIALLYCLSAPVLALAASPATRSVDITVDLNEDGSGLVTEVWNVTIADGTEYYLTKYDLLDGQDITDLSVTDETGREYTNIGVWDSNRDGAEKFGQCGLIATTGGYEICWGIYGDYGDHVYTVRYTMPGLVQAYEGADAVNQTFIANNLSVSPQNASLTIRREGIEFTQENTGVWAFGATGEIYVNNGQVELTLTSPLRSSQYVAVLVEFDTGMFAPAVSRNQTFEDAKSNAMQGSNYAPGEEDNPSPDNGNNGVVSVNRSGFFSDFFWVFQVGVLGAVFYVIYKAFTSTNKGKKSKAEYKDIPYSRELPWNNSLPATYAQLDDYNQLENDGVIIGAYLLRWIWSRQVEILQMPGKKKPEEAIKMYQPRAEMQGVERSLYDMMISAAGGDWVLESKEFEKWSKRNYERVQGWLEQYKNAGKSEIRGMGAFMRQEKKVFFGLIPITSEVLSPVGTEYTTKMFGFKKYLEEFTIINEREAREVELWDEYLIYAQLFGIADKVAEQFRQLYPDYFVQMANRVGMAPGLDMWDVYWLSRMTRSFSQAAYRGSQAGYNAAHSTTFTGGGGGFSGGGGFGGGGFSGGGGGGGTR